MRPSAAAVLLGAWAPRRAAHALVVRAQNTRPERSLDRPRKPPLSAHHAHAELVLARVAICAKLLRVLRVLRTERIVSHTQQVELLRHFNGDLPR